jgi:hypothetical protein
LRRGVAEKNELFPVDPEAFHIKNGKLYLNYNSEVQQNLLKDVDGFITEANANWSGR